VVAAAAALCAVALAPAEAQEQRLPRPGVDRLTPLVQKVHSTPRWFRGTDGRIHIAYELVLTNGFSIPITVESVTVRRAGRRGGTIEQLSGSELEAVMSLMPLSSEPTTTVPNSGIGVVWFEIVLPRGARLPRAIRHTLTVSVPPGLPPGVGVPSQITYTRAFARVDQRPPTVLGPPLRGPGWTRSAAAATGRTAGRCSRSTAS